MLLKTLLRALETKVWDKIWFKSKNFSLNLWATYLTYAFPLVAFRCVPTQTIMAAYTNRSGSHFYVRLYNVK